MRLALVVAVLLAAPLVAGQTMPETVLQAGGGPGRPNAYDLDVTLDVLAVGHIADLADRFTFGLIAGGSIDDHVDELFGTGLVGTPTGAEGVIHWGEDVYTIASDVGACQVFRVHTSHGLSIEFDERRERCNGGFAVAYDPVTDRVVHCLGARGNEPMLVALDRATREEAWALTPDDLGLFAPRHDESGAAITWVCGSGAVDGETRELVVPVLPSGTGEFETHAIVSVDLDTGTERWATDVSPERGGVGGALSDVSSTFTPWGVGLLDTGFVVGGNFETHTPRLLSGEPNVPSAFAAFPCCQTGYVWFDRAGNERGRATVTGMGPRASNGATETAATAGEWLDGSAWPAASGGHAVGWLGTRLVQVQPDAPELVSTSPIEEASPLGAGVRRPPSNAAGAVLLPSFRSMGAYEAATLEHRWSWTPGGSWNVVDAFIDPPGDAYALASRNTTAGGNVSAVDLHRLVLATGEAVQRIPVPLSPAGNADPVAQVQGGQTQTPTWRAGLLPLPHLGQLLVWTWDGQLALLGQADGALLPDVEMSSAYPRVGGHVTISGDTAEPATEWIVSWGDGVIEELEPGHEASHQYDETGDVTLRVTAVYEDGRTATTERAVHVGATPPEELNPLQRAFATDNQDLTFGVLGIALALGGGAIALGRQRTRRRRVQQELDAIERAYADTRERPLACEAALAERRARVRGLGLDGKLDQSEVLLLERRLDELGQELRLESIDEQFAFLSVGMARTLREMLADGRISQWEREHFLAALDEDAHLTKGQKRKIKGQIEAWFARDEGDRA